MEYETFKLISNIFTKLNIYKYYIYAYYNVYYSVCLSINVTKFFIFILSKLKFEWYVHNN